MILFAAAAFAGAVNPWGSATSPGSATVAPYLYVYPDAPQLYGYASAGLGERVDLYLGGGAGTAELFPRWFVHPRLALVPHVYWTPGTPGVVVAPELHANASSGRFALVINAGWRPLLGEQVAMGTVPLIVAPEVLLLDRFSLFTEIDPTFSIGDGVPTLVLLPGASFGFDAHHAAAFGVQVPIAPEVGPASLVAVWTFTFDADGE